MKLLVDECCDAGLVEFLRKEGHDVAYIQEFSPSVTDKDVLEKAYQQKRILVTEDKDFGELVFRLGLKTCGIILLRFEVTDKKIKQNRIQKLLILKGAELRGKFAVVDKDKFRIIALR